MKLIRKASTSLFVLLAAVPLAIVAAFSLGSLWKWVEQTYGLEAYGHSGPAGWCYVASYFGCVALLVAMVRIVNITRRRGGVGSPPDKPVQSDGPSEGS